MAPAFFIDPDGTYRYELYGKYGHAQVSLKEHEVDGRVLTRITTIYDSGMQFQGEHEGEKDSHIDFAIERARSVIGG